MQPEEEPAGALADYSHLPTDALGVVLQHLFAPSPVNGAALPLSEFLARWRAIRLTCRHWSSVLVATPPPLFLGVSTLPEAWLPWLASLPVNTLRIQLGLDERWSPGAGGAGEHPDGGGNGGGPPAGMPAPLSALQLVAGLEGAGLPQPFWSLAAFSRLQCLHLQAPVSMPEAPAVFDSAVALQGLSQLTQLSLGSFAGFRLEQLPRSIRRLRLRYDSQTRTLSVPLLPDHASLDLLQLEKPGALGVCLDDLWGRVDSLDIRARELLLGVPVADDRLRRTFERPYREGMFVPPHIWGDEEADDNSKQAADMTASQFLACLPSAPRLQRLCLSGGAASSVKFMPLAPLSRESLGWLWGVVRLQGLHNLYGLSGQEMEARAAQLCQDRLEFEHPGPERCCIRVLAAGEGAVGCGSLAPAGPEHAG